MNCVSRQILRGLGLVAVTTASTAVDTATAQFPTEPPPAGQLRPLQLPPFDEVTEPENHELPIVTISLTMPGGSSYEPAGKEGLAGLTSEVLLRGTESRTADEIAAEIEGVGSSLNSGAGPDFFTLSTTVLKEHVELAFGLIADVLLNATFPQEEVELALRRTFSALQHPAQLKRSLGMTSLRFGPSTCGRMAPFSCWPVISLSTMPESSRVVT
jgi:hypothetical protein